MSGFKIFPDLEVSFVVSGSVIIGSIVVFVFVVICGDADVGLVKVNTSGVGVVVILLEELSGTVFEVVVVSFGVG